MRFKGGSVPTGTVLAISHAEGRRPSAPIGLRLSTGRMPRYIRSCPRARTFIFSFPMFDTLLVDVGAVPPSSEACNGLPTPEMKRAIQILSNPVSLARRLNSECHLDQPFLCVVFSVRYLSPVSGCRSLAPHTCPCAVPSRRTLARVPLPQIGRNRCA